MLGSGKGRFTKTFQAPDGSVRVLSAGKGSGSHLHQSRNRSHVHAGRERCSFVGRITNAAGLTRLTLTGHNVAFFFPTDNPAGPSTGLVVGREVIAVDASGQFTLVSVTGTTTDICAALT